MRDTYRSGDGVPSLDTFDMYIMNPIMKNMDVEDNYITTIQHVLESRDVNAAIRAAKDGIMEDRYPTKIEDVDIIQTLVRYHADIQTCSDTEHIVIPIGNGIVKLKGGKKSDGPLRMQRSATWSTGMQRSAASSTAAASSESSSRAPPKEEYEVLLGL